MLVEERAKENREMTVVLSYVKTLTLLPVITEIFDFPFPVYDLTTNLILYL